ncbi:hypothetical protein OESDEN_02922 [Oesophagostomum dentatum]|uniref:Uncharacterized protein n=1 Tax=Oesophagostomum dentatum TaxID=61180 RepID=A0A0B1THU6_OESDE|nr:hypothetical protein OESDEN_02922 [Oesophagostomum dentatum]
MVAQMKNPKERTNRLTCVELTKDNVETVYSRRLQRLSSHRGADADEKFMYMSGVRSDDFGHLLVADARSRSLKLLTCNGQFMTKAIISNDSYFPYCSTFAVSPSGLLMACDRSNSRMILYCIGENELK